jgi:Ni/Fe-hydrogenase subunit HybB-like protein
MPSKLHPLWYSPLLPILFYVSAIAVGLAMTIFESWHSAKAFGRELEWPLVQRMSRVLAVAIAVFVAMRYMDVFKRGALATLAQPGMERWMFGLETVLIVVPMVMLFSEKTRQSPRAVYLSVVLFLLGFVANRLNVGITGFEAATGVHYVPKWTEVAVTLAIVAAGFAIFRFAARNLAIFEHAEHPAPQAAPRIARTPVLAGSRGD